jgi:hypothetical protein
MKMHNPTQDYVAEAQSRIAEPVLGVGFLSTAGSYGQLVASAVASKLTEQVSPAGAVAQRRAATAAHAERTQNWMVAVTAEAVYLFPFAMGRSVVAITGEPHVWPRGSYRLIVHRPKRRTQQLHFAFADGSTYDAEVYRGKAFDELTVPLVGLLTVSAAA